MAHNSTFEARIEAAIAELESQDVPKYSLTTNKYFLNHTTLRRRYLGIQLSRAAASSEYRQRLTAVQEVLIKHINDLTNRNLPPTTQIVKNLADEIIGGPLESTEFANLSDDTEIELGAFIYVISTIYG
jgi:hypothetical protein